MSQTQRTRRKTGGAEKKPSDNPSSQRSNDLKLQFKSKAKKISFKAKKKPSYADEEDVSYDLGVNLNKFLEDHLETESVQKIDPVAHELEFRVGTYAKSRAGRPAHFNAFIPRLKFNRMIKYYHEKYQSTALVENISLDIVHDQNYRITVTSESLNNSKNEIEYFCKTNRLRNASYMEKSQVQKSDNPDWNYRLTSSHESEITNQTERLKLKHAVEDKTISKFYRYKYRYSFNLSDQVRIDFTIVKETPQGNEAGTLVSSRTLAQKEKYQVELEYTGNNFETDHLSKTLKPYLRDILRLYMGIKGGNTPISKSHNDLVLSKYLELAVGIDKISLETVYSKPTTTKFLAMDLEALTRQNFNKIRDDYMVTVKADGEHYLLFTDAEQGMYLINNRLEVSPVIFNETKGMKEKLKQIGGCIFDGELVEYEGKWRFLIFDCFFFQGRDLRDLNLFSKIQSKFAINEKCRMFYIKKFVDQISNDLLSDELAIESKDYYPISKVGKFFTKDPNGKMVMKDDLPYNIDGLVFAPVSEGYTKVKYQGGRFIKKGSLDDPENISAILKWKPPEFLSIDFRVSFGEKGRPQYQKINGVDYQVLTVESAYGNKINPFEPSCYRVKDYNKVYVPLTKGQPQLIEVDGYRIDDETLGHVIRNHDILEFIWINDRTFGNDYWGRWLPIKYREDKTQNGYPNNYKKVADKTWLAIHDKQILPENLMDPHGQILESPQLDMGYYQNRNRVDLPNLRGIHNSAKTMLIFLAIKQAGTKMNRLMDLATGRGGDLFKWNGVSYVFGVEFDEGNLKAGPDCAYARYRDRIDKSFMNDRRPPFVLDLIQGDMGELFSDNRVSQESVMNYIMKERLHRNKESFGIISCQFAMHYICDNEDHIDNFFRNIAENLAPNGYFIATTFDGEKIINGLQNTDLKDEDGQPLLVGKDDNKRIMWSISSPIKYSKLENAGQKIFVFNKTIKDEEELEYLVNFNYLIQVARKYNLYPAQLSFGKYKLPMEGYGIGDFADFYEDRFMKLVGDTIFPKGSPKYKELEKNFNRIPADIKRYSKYSSYLILNKKQ